MRIYILRHGQSQANASLSDEIDCGLTDLGRRQSSAVAAALAKLGIACVLSSPYRRCLETAEMIRQAAGAAAELWPAVCEHHHDPFPPGPWPLPRRSELTQKWPNFAAPPDMPETHWAAAAEDRPGQWRRLSGAVLSLLGRFPPQTAANVAVVTHQAPASVLIQAFCQWPNPLNVRVHIDPGSVTVLEVDAAGRRHLVRLNCQPESLA